MKILLQEKIKNGRQKNLLNNLNSYWVIFGPKVDSASQLFLIKK